MELKTRLEKIEKQIKPRVKISPLASYYEAVISRVYCGNTNPMPEIPDLSEHPEARQFMQQVEKAYGD